jgi:DNA polymerase I-like protein with 3'-5' exonuclease and polymerase domains
MKYQANHAASGRPIRFVYSQAAKAGCQNLEAVNRGGDVVAGTHEIFRETGYSLSDLEARGSVLPAYDGRWIIGTIDPRTPLTGNKKLGYKSMTGLVPMVSVDLARSLSAAPRVPTIVVQPLAKTLEIYREKRRRYLSVDIEGHGTDIHLVGVGWDEDTAYVAPWSGSEEDVAALDEMIQNSTPIFHNANYDVPELEIAGVRKPLDWEDTIVLAALYNPSLKKGLQSQVLSWVDGTTTWKGLVDHKRGYDYCGGKVAQYRSMWLEIMDRVGRKGPTTPWHWYCFYNGLDVAYTFRLHAQLRKFLTAQGANRIGYYDNLLKPLHPYVVDMGQRGLPTNPGTRKRLVAECRRNEKKADKALKTLGAKILQDELVHWQGEVARLKRETLATGGKLGDNKEYGSARNKLRTRERNHAKGFNIDAHLQRSAMVYDYLGLPTVGRNGRSTQEDVLEELLTRLRRVDLDGNPNPACKPKMGTLEEACDLLDALVLGKKNATWRRNFLSMPLVQRWGDQWPRLQTEYHLHRATTGRMASGANPDDSDKKVKRQQLQNVPEPLRAPVEADPGMVMVGGDWSNVEWAVVQVMAILVPVHIKRKLGIPLDFHKKLLDRFLAGDLDAHRYLASIAFGLPEEEITKAQRKRCKPYTHGRNFYGAPATLARNAGHTAEVGKVVCKGHERAFAPHAWWEYTIDLVRRMGYIETAHGWRRFFFDMDPKPTEILGTQIQGSAADLCKYVLLDIFRSVDRGNLGREQPWEVLTTTHDSILMQVPKEDEQGAKDWLTRKMEQPIPFLATPDYPEGVCFPADVHSGPTWMDV